MIKWIGGGSGILVSIWCLPDLQKEFKSLAHTLLSSRTLKADASDEDASLPVDQPVPRVPVSGISIWGSNLYGIVDPQQPAVKYVREPTVAGFLPDHVRSLRCLALGTTHAAAIDAKGHLYQWGAYFVDVDQVATARRVPGLVSGDSWSAPKPWPGHAAACTLKDASLKQAACSERDLFALTSKGHLVQMSGNRNIQATERQGRPQYIRLGKDAYWFERAVQIGAGAHHLVACTNYGRVFVLPVDQEGNLFGQLGLGDAPASAEKDETTMQLVQDLGQSKIQSVACGEHHTLALTKQGRVYAWGANEFGQLGVPVNSSEDLNLSKPVEVNGVWSAVSTQPNHRVVGIAARGNTSYFTMEGDEETNVLSCGQGQWGQLGVGQLLQVNKPSRVKNISGIKEFDEQSKTLKPLRVKQVIAGHTHAFAVLDNRMLQTGRFGYDVLSWGSNYTGECLQRSGKLMDQPINIEVASDTADSGTLFSRFQLRPQHVGWWQRWFGHGQQHPLASTLACGDCTTAHYTTVQ